MHFYVTSGSSDSALDFNGGTDIIVIGSGFAGLAAAIEAAEAGATVQVLEKMMALRSMLCGSGLRSITPWAASR